MWSCWVVAHQKEKTKEYIKLVAVNQLWSLKKFSNGRLWESSWNGIWLRNKKVLYKVVACEKWSVWKSCWYINRAIWANLQHRPLKLGRLIVLQETHCIDMKNLVPRATPSFPVPTKLISICLVIFSLKNVKRGHKLEQTYLYACWITHMRHQ